MTHLALAFSTRCGSHTEEEIEHLIKDTPLWQMRDWCKANILVTQRKVKKMKFKAITLLRINQIFVQSSNGLG